MLRLAWTVIAKLPVDQLGSDTSTGRWLNSRPRESILKYLPGSDYIQHITYEVRQLLHQLLQVILLQLRSDTSTGRWLNSRPRESILKYLPGSDYIQHITYEVRQLLHQLLQLLQVILLQLGSDSSSGRCFNSQPVCESILKYSPASDYIPIYTVHDYYYNNNYYNY